MVAPMRTALTIAGSDSGGGAGIQADLKSFAAIGVHGTSVITCVTSQNTRTVRSIFPLPVGEIRSQLRAVLEDFEVRSAKTGMLYSADIVGTVADGLRNTDFPLVVDPVMVATVGASLERDGFRDALVDHLLQRATLVTPNRHEAERLAGFSVRTVESMEKAARAIRRLGAGAVLMKGGHVEGKLVDVFYDGRVLRHLEAYRHEKELHGAGCTLAASIAGYLARGESLFEAVESGRHRVAAGFLTAYRAGRGVGIINSHYHPDRFAIAQSLETAGPRLMTALPASRLATWRALLAYALPSAVRGHDIGVLRFRRKVKSGGLEPAGPTTFDAPRFAVKILQAAMLHDPSMRASIHLKLRTKNVGGLQSSGFTVQPHASWRAQGEKGAGVIPDVIVDEGKTHEGTMVIVLGRNPEDVIGKVRRIARAWMP
jgi:hydroxymethylpyrimidine/phosphomethylpyrimidine kinase